MGDLAGCGRGGSWVLPCRAWEREGRLSFSAAPTTSAPTTLAPPLSWRGTSAPALSRPQPLTHHVTYEPHAAAIERMVYGMSATSDVRLALETW